MADACPGCGGERRLVAMPIGYIGPGKSHILYAYAVLLAADERYAAPGRERLLLCDVCRVGTVTYRGDPAPSEAGRGRHTP